MFSAAMKITAAGRALLAKAQSTGATVTFTGVKIGSGSLGGTDPDTLTDVISAVQTCGITSIARSGSEVRVKFTLTNGSAAYYLREIALMATDPQAGSIAYMYANDGANAELIPAASSTAIEREVTLIVIVSAATSVTATIQSGAYAAKDDFDAHVADTTRHITAAERAAWNAKVGTGTDGKIPSAYLPEMNYIPTAEKAAANGVASLGADGKIPTAQIPELPYAALVNGVIPAANLPDMGTWSPSTITTADWGSSLTASSYKAITWPGTQEFFVKLQVTKTVSGGASIYAYRILHGIVGRSSGILLLSLPGDRTATDYGLPDVLCTTSASQTSVSLYRYQYGAATTNFFAKIKIETAGSGSSAQLRIYAAQETDAAGTANYGYWPVTGTIYRRKML